MFVRKPQGPFTPSISDASAIVTSDIAQNKMQYSCLVQLHQGQLCDEAPEWVCNPFSSIYIDFNENRIISVITELPGVNEPLPVNS